MTRHLLQELWAVYIVFDGEFRLHDVFATEDSAKRSVRGLKARYKNQRTTYHIEKYKTRGAE